MQFCESLPCSEAKVSGLNTIMWQRLAYSPNQKERRLKAENDIFKQQIAHVSLPLFRRAASNAESILEPGLVLKQKTSRTPISSTMQGWPKRD